MVLTMAEEVTGSKPATWGLIQPRELADVLESTNAAQKILLIDSRSFLEFNTHHIQQSINVCCSKLVKRRLQQDKVHIKELLSQTCHIDTDGSWNVIVYDQCSENTIQLTEDLFLIVLLKKLAVTFKSVTLLRGGFLGFQAVYPNLCESKTNNNYKPLTSLSQPCLPVSNVGPTRILPFLYLGSQRDALSQETVQVNGISYILNVSTTCPQAPFIQDGHFLRIPVNDNYSEKMQPFFHEAFQFLDTVRNSNGCVLVHCLAGISRSATMAIAYIMKNLHMSSDDAYRYVKDKRPTISPNFNFLGQLLDFEKQLRRETEESRDGGTPSFTRFDLRKPSTFSRPNNKLESKTSNISSLVFPISMTKSLSCSSSIALSRESPSDCIPSVVCSQISKDSDFTDRNYVTRTETQISHMVCPDSSLDKQQDVNLNHTDFHNYNTMESTETHSNSYHWSRYIPKIPDDLSQQASPSGHLRGDHANSIQTKSAPKRASFLPLGPAVGKKESKTLPLTNLCSSSKPPFLVQGSKPSSYCPGAASQTVHTSSVQSPTTALAKLSFHTPIKENQSQGIAEAQIQLQHFPTTSLDKLNFTPCFVKDEGHMRKKNGATKRSLSSKAVETELRTTPQSSSNTSCPGSRDSSPSHSISKVVLRSNGNRAKRAMVRPNSIAFSSYPSFDLGSDCQNSPCSSSNTSQDDSSETYNSKKSPPCNFGQFAPGAYTEKHLYKKITAAMESAMIKTQAYGEPSRKARSLDDILNSGEEAMETDCNCNSKLGKLPDRCGGRTDLFSPSPMFDHLACRCGGTPDTYQSNSSISSGGSHNSLHGSLEIIQVS